MNRLVLVIIEDVDEIREYYVDYFRTQQEFLFVKGYSSMEDFFQYHVEFPAPDLLLSDINLPGMNGIEGIKKIKRIYPDTNVIMITVLNDSDRIFKSLCVGATGYLLKDTPMPEIKDALLTVQNGGSFMSPSVARKVVEYFMPTQNPDSVLSAKEEQVLHAIIEGLSYKMIATRVAITIDTVRFHIKNIYRKLQVNSKSEVITKYYKGEINMRDSEVGQVISLFKIYI